MTENSRLENITVQDFLEDLANLQEGQSKRVLSDIVKLQDKWTPAFRFVKDERCRLELEATLNTMRQTAIRLELAAESSRNRMGAFDNQMPLFEDEVQPDNPDVSLTSMTVKFTAEDKPALQAGAAQLRAEAGEYTDWPEAPWAADSPEAIEYREGEYLLYTDEKLDQIADEGDLIAAWERSRRAQVDGFLEAIHKVPAEMLESLSDDGNPYAEQELDRRRKQEELDGAVDELMARKPQAELEALAADGSPHANAELQRRAKIDNDFQAIEDGWEKDE